ncbi:MAG: hypothetical protein J6W04_02275 [Bacteroidales bacterium]|nr:hypothetical protein [Bacteroidales bacterium]
MGGSASYRLAKKIANARARGASQEEIDDLERQRQAAKEAEKRKRQEAKQPKEQSFRDKVSGAKTSEELLATLQEKYGSKNVANGFVTKHDLEMTKRAVNTLLELEDRYPFMKGVISGFHNVVDPTTVFDANGSIAAQTQTKFNMLTGEAQHTFGLGAAYATKDNPVLYSGSERGNDIPNMTPEAVVAHEFGHAIHNYLLGRMLQDARKRGLADSVLMADDIKKSITLQRLEKQAKQSIGYKKGMPYFRAEVSGYASGAKMYGGNPTKEAFAESFADVFANGDNASKVSKAYVQVLLDEINRLGYGG